MIIKLILFSLLAAGTAQAQEPRQATLAQQKICADQARKFFLDPEMERKTWVEYSSHYDTKANVCYVMVRSDLFVAGKHSIGFQVFDAFEGIERGHLDYSADEPDHRVSGCTIRLAGQKRTYCNTVDEFDALVIKYFGIERP
jgi:hypothetical protein